MKTLHSVSLVNAPPSTKYGWWYFNRTPLWTVFSKRKQNNFFWKWTDYQGAWLRNERNEKSNIQGAYLPKTSILGQIIVSEILTQFCSGDCIQILLNLTWVYMFRPKSNMRLLVVNNKSNKTNSEKRILYYSYIRLQKLHSSLMHWLKICKAWVRSQLRWAWIWPNFNVMSSNVLRIIIHWLSARGDVGLTQGRLIPKKHTQFTKR